MSDSGIRYGKEYLSFSALIFLTNDHFQMMVSKYKTTNHVRINSMVRSKEKLKQEPGPNNLNTSTNTRQVEMEDLNRGDWKRLSNLLDKMFLVIFAIIEILLLLFVLSFQLV